MLGGQTAVEGGHGDRYSNIQTRLHVALNPIYTSDLRITYSKSIIYEHSVRIKVQARIPMQNNKGTDGTSPHTTVAGATSTLLLHSPLGSHAVVINAFIIFNAAASLFISFNASGVSVLLVFVNSCIDIFSVYIFSGWLLKRDHFNSFHLMISLLLESRSSPSLEHSSLLHSGLASFISNLTHRAGIILNIWEWVIIPGGGD